jgi:ABC-2 type transport system permease protein
VRSMPPYVEGPRRSLSAAAAAFAFGARQALAAWPVLVGRAVFYLVCMAVLSSLWDKVAAARLAHTLATSLPPGGLTLYVGATEWITLSVVAIHLRLEDDIRTGALEPHLLRPKHYLLQKIAESFGGMVVRLGAIGLAALTALAASGRAVPPAWAFLFLAVLGVLGCALGVLLFTLAGLCAFWIRRVLPPYLIVQKLSFVLGGLFAPISLYPHWFYRVAVATPFAANTFFPGLQMLAPSGATFLEGLGAEVFWLLATALLVMVVWQAGIARVLREGLP